jgi:hypothetical protein
MRWLMLILVALVAAFTLLWTESVLAGLLSGSGHLLIVSDGTVLKMVDGVAQAEHGSVQGLASSRSLALVLFVANLVVGVLAVVGTWKLTQRPQQAAA